MTYLEQQLGPIGLEQYASALRREGFETWQDVLDITESDLETLGIKLGHRRRLQRAIESDRHQSGQQPLKSSVKQSTDPTDPRHGPSSSGPASSESLLDGDTSSVTLAPATAKRRYRRHPKPDGNAPPRPPSAYVIFAGKVREEVKNQGLNFSEIAKRVGERWQNPDADERASCEDQAREMREDYNTKLAAYRKTRGYVEYQRYLADFKSRHGDHNARDAKASRVSLDGTHSTRSTSQDDQNASDSDPETDTSPAGGISPSTSESFVHGYRGHDNPSIDGQTRQATASPNPPWWKSFERSDHLSRHSSQSTSETPSAPRSEPQSARAHSGRPWEILMPEPRDRVLPALDGARQEGQNQYHAHNLPTSGGQRTSWEEPFGRVHPHPEPHRRGTDGPPCQPQMAGHVSPLETRSRLLPVPAGLGQPPGPVALTAPGQHDHRTADAQARIPPLSSIVFSRSDSSPLPNMENGHPPRPDHSAE